MPRSLSYTFPAANATDVCQSQILAAAGTLILNGNLVNNLTGMMSFIAYGYSRQISLTSTVNLSGVTFTVIGIQNGISITENITGPNNSTVYSTLVYDQITSITTNGAVATGVSVGSGWQGFFPLIGINLYKDIVNYTLTLATNGTNNSIAVFGTLENIVNNGSTYLNSVNNDYNLFQIKALTALAQYVYSNVATNAINPTYSSLIVQLGTAGAAAINVPIKMHFLQI